MPRPFPTAYVPSRFGYRRRPSLEVTIGAVRIGGCHPLAVQSMCTTPTQDVAATVKQSIVLAEAGCQIVRVTAPGVKDAQALKAIRREFSAAGFAHVPLVADIHFMPAAAMEAIEHVEKVRINPGNFADKKRFAVLEYTDAAYAEEVERVAELAPGPGPGASEHQQIADFSQAFASQRAVYAVLLNRDFVSDIKSLRALSGYSPRFLGMMGSAKRIAQVRNALPEISAFLANLHAPVGLAIGAQTPEEIAVSILAQLIQARAEQLG